MSQDIEKRKYVAPVLNLAKVPEVISSVVNVTAWVSAVLTGSAYIEPDPEFVARRIAFATITAETIEAVFAQANIKGLQKIIPDTPGATTGPLELVDLYVASSDFETGNPSYVIVTAIDMELGTELKFTTGATGVQSTLIGLLLHGVWPIKCQIKRGDGKDKGGRHLLFVLPPD